MKETEWATYYDQGRQFLKQYFSFILIWQNTEENMRWKLFQFVVLKMLVSNPWFCWSLTSSSAEDYGRTELPTSQLPESSQRKGASSQGLPWLQTFPSRVPSPIFYLIIYFLDFLKHD